MKRIFLNKNKHRKVIFILSVIVAIFTINVFTFPASTSEGNCDQYGGCANTVNTKELIEINLYDYGSNINTNHINSVYKYPGFTQSYGVGDIYNYTLGNTDAFHIGDTITTDIEASKAVLGLGINAPNPSAPDPIFWPVRGEMYSTLINDYPALKDRSSLKYLFNSDEGYATKQNKTSINKLFQYDEDTGSYFYNSRDNHAEFNEETDEFIVYNSKITPNFLMYPFGNFLPLNSIENETTKASLMNSTEIVNTYNRILPLVDPSNPLFVTNNTYRAQYIKLGSTLTSFHHGMIQLYGQNYTARDGINQFFNVNYKLQLSDTTRNKFYNDLDNLYAVNFDAKTNFFFGFEMKFNFMQPKNGLTGKNHDKSMVFHFEGDDDVWVYVDGVLFLDLSGIHAQVGGEIDFEKGEVRYYGFDNTTYGVSETPIAEYTITFAEILGNSDKLNEKGTFKDYSTHSLNFYYMERGASSGVMHTRFNLPLIKDHAITIKKELVAEDKDTLGNSKYYFQIVKPDGTLFVDSTYSYNVYDKNDELKAGKEELKPDANGIITLEAGERAVVSGIAENAGKYYVRELLDGEYTNVYVDGKDKLDSNNKTITYGNKTYIIVSSDQKDISDGNGIVTFTNDVNVGKLKIKKTLKDIKSETVLNTSFKFLVTIDEVPIKVGTQYKINNISHTVSELGIIELKPNEEAIIENIIANSKFKVEEQLETTSGLTDSYKINGIDTNNKYASGIIDISNTVIVEVINAEQMGAYIEIPVKKKTTNPDGVTYTYTFTLFDVDKNMTISTKTLTVDEKGIGENEALFEVKYSQLEHSNEETLHKYKVYEEKKTTLGDVVVNNDKYTLYDESVYDIEVKVINNSSGFKATYTISKNGKTVDSIEFNNKRLSSLTIKKFVESDNPNDNSKFNFNIESTEQINGTYKTSSGTDIVFTNGKANVQLSHNESITIDGLPYGSKYKITETNSDGYTAMYKVDSHSSYIDGNEITDVTLSKKADQNSAFGVNYDTVVTFKNIKGYELPKTGSSGMLLLTTISIILISISSMYLLKSKKKIGEI